MSVFVEIRIPPGPGGAAAYRRGNSPSAAFSASRGINKGSGVLEALAELKISAQDVIGIGDAENDFELLDACGCAAAVANALPALARRPTMSRRRPEEAGFSK